MDSVQSVVTCFSVERRHGLAVQSVMTCFSVERRHGLCTVSDDVFQRRASPWTRSTAVSTGRCCTSCRVRSAVPWTRRRSSRPSTASRPPAPSSSDRATSAASSSAASATACCRSRTTRRSSRESSAMLRVQPTAWRRRLSNWCQHFITFFYVCYFNSFAMVGNSDSIVLLVYMYRR